MVMHFPGHLPEHFALPFQRVSAFFQSSSKTSKVRQKIPIQLGLFETIFTSIACNLDAASWHLDPGDLEFAVILYVGKWEKGCFLLGFAETPIKLIAGNLDIVFIKSRKIFHAVENFVGNKKTIAIYAQSISDTLNTIDFEGKQFLSQ